MRSLPYAPPVKWRMPVLSWPNELRRSVVKTHWGGEIRVDAFGAGMGSRSGVDRVVFNMWTREIPWRIRSSSQATEFAAFL